MSDIGQSDNFGACHSCEGPTATVIGVAALRSKLATATALAAEQSKEIERLRGERDAVRAEHTQYIKERENHDATDARLVAVREQLLSAAVMAATSAAKERDTAIAQRDEAVRERDDYRQRKDGAYTERNRCVAALAWLALSNGWSAGLGRHQPVGDPDWDGEWLNVIYIQMPTGQVSWHIHDSHLPLFDGLPPCDAAWDGHNTEEKYARLAALKATSHNPEPGGSDE